MTDDCRSKAVLKIRSSPTLLASTTYPLPAHKPWSAGSLSLCGLPAASSNVPLSTAFRPFTPTAPPEDELMVSQPGPNGWQLTAGGAGSGPRRRTGAGDGKALGPWGEIAVPARGAAASGAARAGLAAEIGVVAGDRNGPVSKEQ